MSSTFGSAWMFFVVYSSQLNKKAFLTSCGRRSNDLLHFKKVCFLCKFLPSKLRLNSNTPTSLCPPNSWFKTICLHNWAACLAVPDWDGNSSNTHTHTLVTVHNQTYFHSLWSSFPHTLSLCHFWPQQPLSVFVQLTSLLWTDWRPGHSCLGSWSVRLAGLPSSVTSNE